jgi:hypothetical protein
MVPVRIRLAITRSGSIYSRLLIITYNTFGWTPVILISQVAPSFRKPLTLYFASTRMRLNTTSIYRMFQ